MQMGERSIKIKGAEFAKLRVRAALTQPEFAERLGMSIRRVQQIESKEIASIFRTPFRKLAELIKVEIPRLDELIRYNGPANGHPLAKEKAQDDFDVNVEPYSEVAVPQIPLFDLPLAAGDWMELTDLCEVKESQIPMGLFRVRLRGDSMKPKYPDGSIVEFHCLRTHLDEAEAGKDYYVQRSDGFATFKRIEKIDDHAVTLIALNRRKYPKRMIVARQEVSRLALAVAKVELVR